MITSSNRTPNWFRQEAVQQVEQTLYAYYEALSTLDPSITSVLTDMPFSEGPDKYSSTEAAVVRKESVLKKYATLRDVECSLPWMSRCLLIRRYCFGWTNKQVWHSLRIGHDRYYQERRDLVLLFAEALQIEIKENN